MTNETSFEPNRRIPWVAVAFSLTSAGVGHVYCGRITKGLVLYFASFVAPLLCYIAALCSASTGVLIGLVLLPTLVTLTLMLYAAGDSYVIATREPSSYRLKDYNRSGVYWLLIVMELMYPVALTAGIREYVFEAFYLPTKSMAPSLLVGDRILVNKVAAKRRFPERGDIVVFRNPEPTGGRIFIKRVIGVSGDRLDITSDAVTVNGKHLEHERLPADSLSNILTQVSGDVSYEELSGRRYKVMYDASRPSDSPADKVSVVVPPRHVYVMGDNRNISRDSRQFGAIHVGDVIGFAEYIFLPTAAWSRFGVLSE